MAVVLGMMAVLGTVAIATPLPTELLPTTTSSVLLPLTNATREAAGQPPLQLSQALEQVSMARVKQLVASHQFTHCILASDNPEVCPHGAADTALMLAAGLPPGWQGENLTGVYEPTVNALAGRALAETNWLNSPGHLANIICPYFTLYGSAEMAWSGTSNLSGIAVFFPTSPQLVIFLTDFYGPPAYGSCLPAKAAG